MKLSKVLALGLVAMLLVAAVATAQEDEEPEMVIKGDVEMEVMATDAFTSDDLDAMESQQETHEFEAEVSRLMDIIINSLYSNRDIFLREIISNAADALDKIRFQGLTDKSAVGDIPLEIRVKYEPNSRTLSVRDTGVGMTKEELKKNLGVVAKSGTTEFVEAVSKESDNLSLIGQFGVGFYSVYLVADRVTVISKNNDDKQYIWQSEADRTFTVTEDPRGNTLGRGTEVILHLKEDAKEFLAVNQLKDLITRYSSFINYPILLRTISEVTKSVPVEDDDEEASVDADVADADADQDLDVDESDDLEVDDADEEAEEKPKKTKQVKERTLDWVRLNEAKAVWTRRPGEVEDEEYDAFYTALTGDEGGYLSKIHFAAEGEISFRSIMYIPETAEAQLYDKFYEKSRGLKLYVRRVLISDEFDEFLPRYLNFVKGVVDSDDLPLNVNRQTLAQDRVLKVMSKKITRKVLEMLRRLAEESKDDADEFDEEETDAEAGEEADAEGEGEDAEEKVDKYALFWKQYGKSLKLGLIDDRSNKAKLSKLLRYETSFSEGGLVSLEEYVDNMADDQKYIYYITGESVETVAASPFLERLNKRGYEVLYFVDPLDEYLSQSLTEFDGIQLASITKENLRIDDDDKEKIKSLKEQFSDFTEFLESVFGSKVEKVVVSNRLTSSPCVLVTGAYGWTANMERLMASQTFSDKNNMAYMRARKTLEINPKHPIITELASMATEDPDNKAVEDLANLLYDAALMNSGFQMEDPNAFAHRLHRMMLDNLNVDPDNIQEYNIDDYVPPVEEDEEADEEADEEGKDEL